MPLGQPALKTEDADLIRAWILDGAKNDSEPEPTSSTGPIVYLQPPVITALRFSPDGNSIAVSGNREVLLHKADGSAILQRFQGKAERILFLAFSKDGGVLVTGGGTPAQFGEVQIWIRNRATPTQCDADQRHCIRCFARARRLTNRRRLRRQYRPRFRDCEWERVI